MAQVAFAVVGGLAAGAGGQIARSVGEAAGAALTKYSDRLGFAQNGSLAAVDVQLLREIHNHMTDGPLKDQVGLVNGEGQPRVRPWPATGPVLQQTTTATPSSSSSRPEVRRVGEYICRELGQYMEGKNYQHVANARTVFAWKLGHWADDVRQRDPSAEDLDWWLSLLLRIEDHRLFTKSNYVRESGFETVLRSIRLKLHELRYSKGSELEHERLRVLEDYLQAIVNEGHAAMDRLKEFLGHRLDNCAIDKETEALQAELLMHLDAAASQGMADALGQVLLQTAGEYGVATTRSTEAVARFERLCGSLRASPVFALARLLQNGRAVDAYLELYGLLCFFLAMLSRIQLMSSAVREFGGFVCYLPLHQTCLVDLRDVLPALTGRMADNLASITAALGSPGQVDGPRRQSVLESRREADSWLLSVAAKSRHAVQVLSSIRTWSTAVKFQEFRHWDPGDNRWLQLADIAVAAEALLPHGGRGALDADRCADALRLAHRQPLALTNGQEQCTDGRCPDEDAAGCEADSAEASSDRAEAAAGGFARHIADEGTRVHELLCTISEAGQKAKDIVGVVLESSGLTGDSVNIYFDKATSVTTLLADKLRGQDRHYPEHICDGDWVLPDFPQAAAELAPVEVSARPPRAEVQ